MEKGRVQKCSGKGNPGLSSTTVWSVHLTPHCAFERAIKERLSPRNPGGEVMLSRPKTETSVRQMLIPQDTVDLLIQEHSKPLDNQYMFPSPVTGEVPPPTQG